MKVYVKINKRGYIVDYLLYSHEGFFQTNYDDVLLPRDLTMGYYKVMDDNIVMDEIERKNIIESNKSEIADIAERLQHGMENTKAIKANVETLEEQLANEVLANFKKETLIKDLEEKLEVANATNNDLTEQLAVETMNSFELEGRVTALEELLKGGAGHE